MATKLGNALERAIKGKTTESRSRADVVSAMASAAGISESTVGQILRGEIDKPPKERLSGFARVLGVASSRLFALAGHTNDAAHALADAAVAQAHNRRAV